MLQTLIIWVHVVMHMISGDFMCAIFICKCFWRNFFKNCTIHKNLFDLVDNIKNIKCYILKEQSFFHILLYRLLNVNFDTECKVLGSRLEKFFQDKFFTELQLQQNNVQCGKLSFYSTLFNYDIKKLENAFHSLRT